MCIHTGGFRLSLGFTHSETIESMGAEESSSDLKVIMLWEAVQQKDDHPGASSIVLSPAHQCLRYPTFSGKLSQIVSFRSVFNSVYGESDIESLETLTMFKNKLKDSAKQVEEYLGEYQRNYKTACPLLN